MLNVLNEYQIELLEQVKTELFDLERFTITFDEFNSWFNQSTN